MAQPIFRPGKASAVEYLVDTGPLVRAFWGRHQWHSCCRETLISLGANVWTTETVLAEAAHQLKPNAPALLGLLDALQVEQVRLISLFPDEIPRCAELVVKFAPRMDAGDATLFILSERFPRAKLIPTEVGDFTIHRRRDGRAVPIIAPQH